MTPQRAVVRDDDTMLTAAAAGWNVNRRGAGGATALVLAARQRKPRMTKALRESGASPRIANNVGQTALRVAVEGCQHSPDRTRVAELLLVAGADPNVRDQQGRTALHVALAMVHTFGVDMSVVRALAAHGADPRLRDRSGKTAMETDAIKPLHHDVNGDAMDTVARRDAAVAEVTVIVAAASRRASKSLPG